MKTLILRAVLVTIMASLLALTAGCLTSGAESDLPWNTPASWEGSPTIPGLTPEY